MNEKRKDKRLEISVEVQLERLDKEDITTLKYAHVNVTDISKGGIGFETGVELEMESTYECKIRIWSGETLDTIIKIVRITRGEDNNYHYGAIFVGMNDTDASKIEIYRMFNDL